MIVRVLAGLALVATLALAASLVVLRSRGFDDPGHRRYASALSEIAARDAVLDEQLLRAASGLSKHYDPIVAALADVRRLARVLETPPRHVSLAARAELDSAVIRLNEAIATKEGLVESFKSESAVLRNSLRYFPIAAERVERAAGDGPLARDVERLVRDLLAGEAQADTEIRRRVEGDLESLARRRSGSPLGADLDVLAAHARVVLERRPHCDRILREVAAVPTASHLRALALAYDREHERALAAAASARLATRLLAVAALGLAVASVAVHLRRTALALRAERDNVERLLLGQVPGVELRQRYRLLRRLGEGGMGVVWAATHTLTGKPVALKFVKGLSGARPEVRRRLLREARAAAILRHPAVVPIHDVVVLADGSPVLVMDLLNGQSLGERLAAGGALSLAETAAVLLPVVSAIGTAHAAGILHRDLKPDNVFLVDPQDGGEREIKVLDFGVAKLIGPGGPDSESQDLTRTGDRLGTTAYMSPEQAFGEPDIDHRTDVWSLGVILYECLAGARPFTGENAGQVLKRTLTAECPPLAARCPELPQDVVVLVSAMLRPDRDERLADLRPAAAVLARYTAVRVPDFGAPQARTEA